MSIGRFLWQCRESVGGGICLGAFWERSFVVPVVASVGLSFMISSGMSNVVTKKGCTVLPKLNKLVKVLLAALNCTEPKSQTN